MPGLYTEADYENSVVELFRNMGYSYLYGPDVERDFYTEKCRVYGLPPERYSCALF